MIGILPAVLIEYKGPEFSVTDLKICTPDGLEKKFLLGEGPYFIKASVKCTAGAGENFSVFYEVAGNQYEQKNPGFRAGAGQQWNVMWSPGTAADYNIPVRVSAGPAGSPPGPSAKGVTSTVPVVIPDQVERSDPAKFQLDS